MATFVNDTFTDTDGVQITAHTGETGATWTRNTAWGAVTNAIISTNRLRDAGTNMGAQYYPSGSPANADYEAQADLFVASLITTEAEQAGIGVRGGTSTATGYFFRYVTSSGSWSLVRITSTTTNTSLGTFAQTLTVGSTYTMKIRVLGSTITCFVNGTSVISVTDTNVTAAGKPYLFMNMPTSTPSGSIGLRLDNFSATDVAAAPPANSVAPAITGTAQEGQTVTCDTGTWTNSPSSFTYQWKRNGTNISGSTSSTYVLATADVSQSITCTVTATNPAGSASATSNTITPIAAVSPPANTVAPAITGTAQQDQILSCSAGTWSNSPTGFTYQWKRAGVAISGATASTYLVTSLDVGQAVKCTVTATNAGGSTAADSNTVTPTGIPVPANTVAPVISGAVLVGQTLTSTTGTWSNNPTGFSYQWTRNGTNITGAVGSSYSLATGDDGTLIRCVVTATNPGGTASAQSNSLTILPAPAPGVLSAPVITGTAQTGAQLFCSTGAWSGSPGSFTYQWRRDGVAIAGETSATHVVVTADEGHAISCVVTAANGSLTTSVPSNSVVPVPVNSVGTVPFFVQVPTTGLAGIIAMQVIDAVTGNVLIARSTANIDEFPAGSGVYRALRVTAPPSGALVVWDDGNVAAGHVATFRY